MEEEGERWECRGEGGYHCCDFLIHVFLGDGKAKASHFRHRLARSCGAVSPKKKRSCSFNVQWTLNG